MGKSSPLPVNGSVGRISHRLELPSEWQMDGVCRGHGGPENRRNFGPPNLNGLGRFCNRPIRQRKACKTTTKIPRPTVRPH